MKAQRLLRDSDIREHLLQELRSPVVRPVPSLIINELPVQYGSAIIDIAVIDGELTGYEIKSDVDSLRRLAGQIDLYQEVFDRLYVVTTPSWLERVTRIIPIWVGLVIIEEEYRISVHRSAEMNIHVAMEVVLDLLTRSELSRVVKEAGLRRYSADAKHILCGRVLQAIGTEEAKRTVQRLLSQRIDWSPRQLGVKVVV